MTEWDSLSSRYLRFCRFFDLFLSLCGGSIVNAITSVGWVEGAQLVFEAKKRTGDYHGQMNWENFSNWFKNQLLPNLPKRSLIILDNARYHNVLTEDRFPKPSVTKDELRDWLTRNKHPWRDDMLKSELYDESVKHAPAPEFRLDDLAMSQGHKILRTPQYHPELQPIEACWAVVKNHMADKCDFTMSGMRKNLPEAFAKVTKTTCSKVIAKVRQREDDYWENDAILDEQFASASQEDAEILSLEDVPKQANRRQLLVSTKSKRALVYGQIVKEKENGKLIKITYRIRCGAERLNKMGLKIGTSLLERLNLTIRHALSPLTRKTLGFSKKRANLRKQTTLFQAFYNFARPHMSLREKVNDTHDLFVQRWEERTPGMAAGITDHVWTFRELLTAKFCSDP